MIIPRLFKSAPEMDKWLKKKFGTTIPEDTQKKKFGSEVLSEPKFIKSPDMQGFGFFVLYKEEEFMSASEMAEMFIQLPISHERDGEPCYEGTAGSISKLFNIPVTLVLKNLRILRDEDKGVFYSADGLISPKSKAGIGPYWRVLKTA